MLFKNATIYTMEEEPFIGDFRVDKGVFTEIGKNLEPKGRYPRSFGIQCVSRHGRSSLSFGHGRNGYWF